MSLRISLLVALLVLLAGCATPPEPEPELLGTRFQIDTEPPGAHVIVASPQGLAPIYLGQTPVREDWQRELTEGAAIPETVYVLVIRPGSFPAEERVAFTRDGQTVARIPLTKGAPTVLMRSRFKSYMTGLSVQDIMTIWGTPESTQATHEDLRLYYTGITYDPLAKLVDETIEVITRDGRVTGANFY
jgi:hypothetical protein